MPTNEDERLVSCIMILTGLLFFSSLVIPLAVLAESGGTHFRKNREKLNMLENLGLILRAEIF